jgi:hypothetical protein
MTVGGNGYVLLRRRIAETDPGEPHPRLSPDFSVRRDESSPGQKVIFRRFYFAGQLLLGRNRRQKRAEVVNVRVVNPSFPHGREKSLHFRLNAVQLPKKYPPREQFVDYERGDRVLHEDSVFECRSSHLSEEKFDDGKWKFIEKIPDALPDDSGSSFFATSRGKNAIRYALRRAIALISHSSRRTEIDFCVDAEKFLFATVDDEITIRGVGSGGGIIRGKIIRTEFRADGGGRLMRFTVACREADLSENFAMMNSAPVAIDPDDDRGDPCGAVVRKIEIKNSPEEQISILSASKACSVDELREELGKHATKIKLSLRPVNTTKAVVREITLPDVVLKVKSL